MPSTKRANSYQPRLALTATTLAVQFAGSRSASIPRRRLTKALARRDRQGGKGGDTTTDTDSDDTDDSDDDDKPPPNHSSSKTSSSSHPTSTPNSSSHSITSSSSTTTSNSSIQTADAAIASGGLTKPISTGGIIGAVVGSLIIAGLLLMILAQCIRRSRKARKRPQGFVPSDFFAVPQNEQRTQTEMSQTQSSPLISSAIAAGATSSQPSPIISSRYSHSSNPTSSYTPSLSPHILADSLHHSRSLGRYSISDQTVSGGASDSTSSAHEPLQSPYESPPYSLAASSSTGLAAAGAGVLPLVGAALLATNRHEEDQRENVLHRSMVAHQKALESSSKGQEGQMQTNKPDDPPPRYDA